MKSNEAKCGSWERGAGKITILSGFGLVMAYYTANKYVTYQIKFSVLTSHGTIAAAAHLA